MSKKDIVQVLNKACDELDFIEARRIAELNIDIVREPQVVRLLNQNAREIVKLVVQMNDNNFSPLTRSEKVLILSINQAANQFDLPKIKHILKTSLALLLRQDVYELLNGNARAVIDTFSKFSNKDGEKDQHKNTNEENDLQE